MSKAEEIVRYEIIPEGLGEININRERDGKWVKYKDAQSQLQEHTAQTLDRLKDRIKKEVGSWDSDDRFNECKEQILQLIEEVRDE